MDKLKFLVFFFFSLISFHFAYSQDSGKKSDDQDNKLFAFGIIADVQYADTEKAGSRDYKNSIYKLEKCITEFNNHNLAFTINLGDLIDRNFESYDKPLAIMEMSQAQVYYVIGNHEFSVEEKFKGDIRSRLYNKKGYFDFEVGNLVFIVLDGTDISTFAYKTGSRQYELAMTQYEEMKKQGFNNATTWNGGIGEKQLEWLKERLNKAEQTGQKVILFCHWPLLPENGTQLWNNRQVLDLINSYTCVKAWISGHHHAGHYEMADNIHHLTIKGMVEATSETSCGIMEVYPGRLWLKGFGDQKDYNLEILK